MTTHGTTRSLRQPARALGIFCLLLGGAFAAPAARAADEASAFIADFSQDAIAIMKNPAMSKTDRQFRFEALMAEDFDLPKIARFVLGTYWRTATATERQEFTTAFGTYMMDVYSTRFADYDACSFHCSFRVTMQFAASETMTVVESKIVRVASGAAMDVNWVVAKTPDSYKVIDVAAGSASLSRAQRAEFSAVVHRSGGIAGLIRQLQLKSTELSDAAR